MKFIPFSMGLNRSVPGTVIGLLLLLAAIQPSTLPGRSPIVAVDTEWKYFDDANGPEAAWHQTGFDDSKWKSGKAPLGYGETRLGTALEAKLLVVWFRREFDTPVLNAGEGLVILLCVDDGAIVYLNGEELERTNLPDGPVTAKTPALRTLGDRDEGYYARVHLPADALLAGKKNVLAIEVHNISTSSSDLYFDSALKVVPPEVIAEVTDAAAEEVLTFNKQHYLGPETKIPDGYIDGGRGMKVEASGEVDSRREILTVDRTHDTELSDDLMFARSADLRALPELERVQRIAARIAEETTPPGGLRWVVKGTEDLQKEFADKAILIGDWIDQGHAGVCRHRSLLFKILADEAGLKTALVRGNYIKGKPPGFAHAWNEVFLADGRRLLVDVMHNGGKAKFLEVTDPYVIEHYGKVDDTPWYHVSTEP